MSNATEESENMHLGEKIDDWVTDQRAKIKEYEAFYGADAETLKWYTDYVIPVPPKDKPFIEEFPDEETNPVLMEMREAGTVIRTGKVVGSCVLMLPIIAVAGILRLTNAPAGFRNGLLLGLTLNQVAKVLHLTAAESKFEENYDFVLSLTRVDPNSATDRTYWNGKRWEKWAMARYELTSTEELFYLLKSGKLAIIETGPMAGLTVYTDTGLELPLRITELVE